MLAIAVASLSACGGSGSGGISSGGSTPPPAGESYPSNANTDLLTLTLNESFTNDGAGVSGTYTVDGLSNSAEGERGITIRYDASSQSYFVSNGSNSATFLPGQIDASQSVDGLVLYEQESGSTTQTLSLIEPGSLIQPTRYVAGGYYQRVVDRGSSFDASFDAFTYGVETPAAGVPRTGSARYDVLLIGMELWGVPSALSGFGTMEADFSSNKIYTSGELLRTSLENGSIDGPEAFYGIADISASANGFSGTFGYQTIPESLEGEMAGRFYGPNGEEIGAVWSVNSTIGERVATGTLVGVDGGPTNVFRTLTDLSGEQVFDVDTNVSLEYVLNGDLTGDSGFGFHRTDTIVLDFDTGDVTLVDSDHMESSAFAAADLVDDPLYPGFSTYRTISGDLTETARIFDNASNESGIELTYASFALREWVWNRAAGYQDVELEFLTYGLTTDPALVPRTGDASYSGSVIGLAVDQNTHDNNIYDVSGPITMDVAFWNTRVAGEMTLTGVARDDAATLDFGRFTFGGSTEGATFDGRVNPSGLFEGAFYGPQTDEVALTFFTTWQAPDATDVFADPLYRIEGLGVMTKDP